MTKTARNILITKTMARPTESPSGLRRENKTIRIDPILASYAIHQSVNFSAVMESALMKECEIDSSWPDGFSKKFARYLIKNHIGHIHVFDTVEKLNSVSIEWDGQVVTKICEQCRGLAIEDLLSHLQDPNHDADGFDLKAVAKDWPIDVPDAYNRFYCEENDVFGTYFMSRNAWQQMPG